MAFITLQGTLLDPNGSLSIGDELRFTHKSTTGSTLKSAVTLMKLTTLGNYYIDLQYGLVLVEYKDVKNNQFENLGVVTVNQDSAATTLPELLNAIVPPTDAQLLEFQAILADCVSQVTLATTQAVRSETAASVSEAFANQLTTTQLIASTATYAADVSLGTSGFTTSGDGGNGSWKQNGITGQTPSQSPVQLGDALLNDGNGNQWVLVKGVSGDTRKTGASTANSDNYLAIIAMHNSLNDGDTLLIPDGVFLTSAIVTTKRINHVITGELRRSSDTTITDSVLEIQGDRSTLYGGGVVSWNAGAGNDTGRGEAIRLSGDTIYANNITGADTFSGTGNAWYVSGVGCILDSCRGLNSAYAGVRSNMSAVDGDGEPTGQMTITNFVATNCRRGWVNNGFADCITIDNFQVKDLPVNADVQLLGETGEDIRFNKLIMTNTFIHQNLSVDARSLVKFVGIKEVNLTNCDFDVLDSVDVDALTLQNEHAGSETYQENTLNATQCRFRSYNTTVLNVDQQEQWRLNTKQCQFIVDLGAGRDNMIDIDAGQYWYSVDDTFECQTSATTYAVRVENVGAIASKRFSFIRPKFKGQALSYFIGFVGTEFNIGQFQISDPKFDTQPTSANWMFNSSTRDPKVIISEISLGKDTGRSFSASSSAAIGLSAADYEQGDRVHIKDVGDTGIYMKIKGATVWRDFS